MNPKRILSVYSVIFGVLLCAVFMQAAPLFAKTEAPKNSQNASTEPDRLSPKSIGSDSNEDGQPDKWEYYEQGVLVKIEADSNFDGKVDEWGVIESGRIVRVEKDSDYDGKVDKWVNY